MEARTARALDEIRDGLAKLYAEPLFRPPGYERGPHGRTLRPRLARGRLVAFEAANGVQIPAEYSAFLTELGDGGVGPSHGLRSLSPWRDVELPTDLVDVDVRTGTHRGLIVVDEGASGATALLVAGPEFGRIAEIGPDGKAVLRPEPDFLSWFGGWLRTATPLRRHPRSESTLRQLVRSTADEHERAQALHEMGSLPALSVDATRLIHHLATADPSSAVRYQAIELLGELDIPAMGVFLAALEDQKRAVSRRSLVHILRLGGTTEAWRRALAIVRAGTDEAGIALAEELERRRARGVKIETGA